MIAVSGYIQKAAQALFKPKRSIGEFVAQVTISETHSDDMEITDHPVELGSQISDHTYKLPASVVIKCGWSNSASNLLSTGKALVSGGLSGLQSTLSGNSETQVKAIYAKLLKAQADRTLMDVYTGKRIYKDMLVKSIHMETKEDTENSLIVTITLRQVILVTTQTLKVVSASIATDTTQLADAKKNAVPVNNGTKQLAIPASKPPLPTPTPRTGTH